MGDDSPAKRGLGVGIALCSFRMVMEPLSMPELTKNGLNISALFFNNKNSTENKQKLWFLSIFSI